MVTRRTFALGALSLPLLGKTSLAELHSTANSATPLIVVFSGIDPAAGLSRLEALYKPFLQRGIPVTLGLSLKSGDDTLGGELRRIADVYPHLVEFAIDAGNILSADPYWQLRQASTLQAQFTKLMNPAGDIYVEPLLMAMTLLTPTPARGIDDLGNIRAAGIRTAIHLKPQFADARNLDPGYWLAGTGLRHAFVSASVDAPAPFPATDSLAVKSGPVIYHIPSASLAEIGDADLPAYAKELARQLGNFMNTQHLRSELPHTVYMQSQAGPSRYVIVRIDDYRLNPRDTPAHIAFTGQLTRLGIPMTEAVIPGGAVSIRNDAAAKARLASLQSSAGYEAAAHGLDHGSREMAGNALDSDINLVRESLRAISDATGAVPATFIPPNNAFDDNSLAALARCGVANFSADQGSYDWIWGLDRHGLLHGSNIVYPEKNWEQDIPLFAPEEMLNQLGARNDAVFMIHPATLSTAQKRRDCFDLLEKLRNQPGTELTTFANYADKVTQPMPMLQTIRKTRSMVEVVDSRETGFTPPSPAELMEDAATAWTYFDAWKKKFDTAVPATGWRRGKTLEAYPFLTMWDMASLIMAHVSAHRIGLIDGKRFDRAAAKIVRLLAASTFKFKTSALPMAEIPIGRARGQRQGFDATDTGRLLIALKILDEQTAQSLNIAKLVHGWDLPGIAPGGEAHNVSKGRLNPIPPNSYGHYVSRGFGLWGVALNPAFKELRPLESMDATLRFLDEVRARGRIATEPSTTELVEIGESEPGKIMSDMLLAAQIERHERTGIATCVSEGPLDRRPWFAYQGYQIAVDGSGGWLIDGPPGGKKYLTAKTVEDIRTVSTKGCFLWMAARPGAYSSMLYRLARERAKIDGLGFASGIFENTLKRTDHSDINTNGIILEALAFMLNGRKPLLGASADIIGPLTQLR